MLFCITPAFFYTMRKFSYCIYIFVVLLVSCTVLFAHQFSQKCDNEELLIKAQQQGGIREPLLIDSLVVGLKFAVDEDEMKWYNGDFFYLDFELPAFRKITFGYDDIDTIVMIPVEERKFINNPFISIVQSGLGQTMYQRIIEEVSAKRLRINFYQLYQNNKHILHKALSKEEYTYKYRPMVNVLLRAYSDIKQDSTLLPAIECIMKKHEEDMLKGNIDQDLNEAYMQIKRLLSEETLTSYIEPNPISVVWSYTFWLRRKYEDKTDDIYRTLLAIQSDYEEL